MNTPGFLSWGGLDMTFLAGGSRPSLNAGNDDVIMLIQRISSGAMGKTE